MVDIHHRGVSQLENLFSSCVYLCVLCFAPAAPESERGEGVHRECGQEAGHHGPADQVSHPAEPAPTRTWRKPKAFAVFHRLFLVCQLFQRGECLLLWLQQNVFTLCR